MIVRGTVQVLPPLERPTVIVTDDVTIKIHKNRQSAEEEARWYAAVPWAAPALINFTGRTLVIQTLPTCWHLPDWRPIDELIELINRLHAEGIHHRDIHRGNIVQSPTGLPLLIDWETAIRQDAPVSYDLAGPEESGVPSPEYHHQKDYQQWWNSPSSCSLAKVWSHEL